MTDKEPIAIVGIGCRLPGKVNNVEDLWRLLTTQTDAVIPIPANRWDIRRFNSEKKELAGKTYAYEGGFLDQDIFTFEPGFFGISPRAAEKMDPQQRLLLEVTSEAFDDAGIRQDELQQVRTGVYMGAFNADQLSLGSSELNYKNLDSSSATASTHTIISARLSHVFNLKGPCFTTDTACSSSLTAFHLACQGIWNSECDVAIAGGVNVILLPSTSITMSKGGFLSPTSRCHTFDEAADGYCRGEGAGVVILKPLSQAIAHDDDIYAVVTGTGINQDGKTSALPVPSKEAQVDLIQDVFRRYKINPDDIDYVEAHGTGTQLGDITELSALSQALRSQRRDRDIYVGSIKSNIGHLEGAAGIASVIKTALVIKHKTLVPNCHFHNPNKQFDFAKNNVHVPTAVIPLENDIPHRPITTCINSFGYGGTNAHAVLRGIDHTVSKKDLKGPTTNITKRPFFVPISVPGEASLSPRLDQLRHYLKTVDPEDKNSFFRDLVYTFDKKRSNLSYRAAIKAHSFDTLVKALKNGESAILAKGPTVRDPKLAFVYTGMGPQWWAMGRTFFTSNPIAKACLDACEKEIRRIAKWSIKDAFFADEETSNMHRTQVAQPANFVLQAALTKYLSSIGVSPDAVVGHSIGEVGAAYASGAISLEEGLHISYYRSLYQAEAAGQGGMLAANLPEEEARALIKDNRFKHVDIAAINDASSVTLSGRTSELKQIEELLTRRDIFNRILKVEVAYHSHQMNRIKDRVLDTFSSLKGSSNQRDLYSTVTGAKIKGKDLTGHYWWRNIRKTVLFEKALSQMIDDGYNVFVEIGPHPVLRRNITHILNEHQREGVLLESLNRNESDDSYRLERLSGELYQNGVFLFDQYWNGTEKPVKIPPIPFQRKRYWHESPQSLQLRTGSENHPFLQRDINSPLPSWKTDLNAAYFPYLTDHKLEDTVVFPGAGYMETGLAIAHSIQEGKTYAVEDVTFFDMLMVNDESNLQMFIQYDPSSRYFHVYSGDDQQTTLRSDWKKHASGKIFFTALKGKPDPVDIDALKKNLPFKITAIAFYKRLRQQGLVYGPQFQNIRHLWASKTEILAKLEGVNINKEALSQYYLHPGILDAAIQAIFGASLSTELNPGMYVPVRFRQLNYYEPCPSSSWAHCVITEKSDRSVIANVSILNQEGEAIAIISDLELQMVGQPQKIPAKHLYQLQWRNIDVSNLKLDGEIDKKHILVMGPSSQTLAKKLQVPTTRQQDLIALLKKHKGKQKTVTTVLFTSLPKARLRAVNHAKKEMDLCQSLLQLLKELDRQKLFKHLKLCVIQDHGLSGSGLLGVTRVASSEFLDLSVKNITMDFTMASIKTLLNCLSLDESYQELRLHKGQVSTPYLGQGLQLDTKQKKVMTSKDTPFSLKVEKPGLISSLAFYEDALPHLQKGYVRVRNLYTSLNFKDIMKVMNLLPDAAMKDTFFGQSLGMESYGEVIEVGPGVKHVSVGDNVVPNTPDGTFKSVLDVPGSLVTKVSKRTITPEDAISFVAFTTAISVLEKLARLKKDEWVLIHGGAGAVGLACIQYAQYVGAQIVATVGSPEKKAYLESIGVTHILHSRTLDFCEQIKTLTEGRGVDVVVNAISGDALLKSWELMADGGRFIEIGKQDIVMNSHLPMSVFNREVSFISFDLDRATKKDWQLSKKLFKRYSQLLEAGVFTTLPFKFFNADQVSDAFNFMLRSKHIGKIGITFKDQSVSGVPLVEQAIPISPEATYLITGGLKGLGTQIATWLYLNGARHLVLVSRTGIADDASAKTIRWLQTKDVSIKQMAVDVADKKQVSKCLENIEKNMPVLKGIVHSAGIISDGLINTMEKEEFEKVFVPKSLGAWNLHLLSLKYPLDLFICMSSISALIGNIGQANYVAANAYLDELARFRRLHGLPGMSINWGAFVETGMASRNKDVIRQLEIAGLGGLSNQDLIEGLDMAIKENIPQFGVFEMDWTKWRAINPKLAKTVTFQHFSEGTGAESELKRELAKLNDHEEQIAFVSEHLVDIVATVIRIDKTEINPTENLESYGIDSLMVVEIQSTISKEFQIEIPVMALMDSNVTVRKLSTLVVDLLFKSDDASDKPDDKDTTDDIESLSESEVDQLLENMLQPDEELVTSND